jgi:hypothetical protein
VSARVKVDPFVKIKTILVSSRSWFGRPSQMEREVNRWTDKGWRLIDHQQIGNTKRYALVFQCRLSPKEIRAQKRRRLGLQLGCATLLVSMFALAWAAGNSSIFNRNPAPTMQQAISLAETVASPTATRFRPSTTPTTAELSPTDPPKPTVPPSHTATTANTTLRASRTPRLTATPTVSRTPRPTVTPIRRPSATATNSPTATASTTPTQTATATPSMTPTSTPTVTPSPIITDTPAPTPVMLYTAREANVRDCPRTTCAIQTTLPVGVPVYAVGLEDGESVSGSSTWRTIVVNGREGYVHDSLMTTSQPRPISNPPVQHPGLISTPVPPLNAPVSNYSCVGDNYNCGDFQTCDQIRAYFATCPGDPSQLDRDRDGRYCESVCGG